MSSGSLTVKTSTGRDIKFPADLEVLRLAIQLFLVDDDSELRMALGDSDQSIKVFLGRDDDGKLCASIESTDPNDPRALHIETPSYIAPVGGE
jgi:hypothetical protein